MTLRHQREALCPIPSNTLPTLNFFGFGHLFDKFAD